MTTDILTAKRYVFVDIAIIEIFNPDEKIWDYYLSIDKDANLIYVFGVQEQFSRDNIRELWKNGYFENFKNDA